MKLYRHVLYSPKVPYFSLSSVLKLDYFLRMRMRFGLVPNVEIWPDSKLRITALHPFT